MSYTLAELLEKIAERYDPDELVELLCLDSEILVQRLADDIADKLYLFKHIEEEL